MISLLKIRYKKIKVWKLKASFLHLFAWMVFMPVLFTCSFFLLFFALINNNPLTRIQSLTRVLSYHCLNTEHICYLLLATAHMHGNVFESLTQFTIHMVQALYTQKLYYFFSIPILCVLLLINNNRKL